MKFTSVLIAVFALSSLCMLGCQQSDPGGAVVTTSDPHDHDHEHPETLQEGVKLLGDLYAAVKTAFESGDPEAAHGELHEVGGILEKDFPALIQKDETLSPDTKSQLESTVATLFDNFTKLDGVLHGGPEVEFSEVDAGISQAMADLQNLIP